MENKEQIMNWYSYTDAAPAPVINVMSEAEAEEMWGPDMWGPDYSDVPSDIHVAHDERYEYLLDARQFLMLEIRDKILRID